MPAPGSSVEPFHGDHQAGVETAMQPHATFVALDLRDDVDRAALVRLMRLLTDDVARLSEGRPALADPAAGARRGAGPADRDGRLRMGLLEAAGLADRRRHHWLAEGLPKFSIDELQAGLERAVICCCKWQRRTRSPFLMRCGCL